MTAYLKIPGIRGGSTEPAHVDWIEITRFACSLMNRPGQTLGHEDLKIEKPLDEATPLLAQAVLAATSFAEVVIELHPESVQDALLTLTFRGVRIESQALGEVPGESLFLKYDGFRYAMQPGGRRPPVVFSWPPVVKRGRR